MTMTLAAAAAACGCHKVTLLKKLQRGVISGVRNDKGEWLIDPSELARAELLKEQRSANGDGQRSAAPDTAATDAMVALLREQLADMRSQRDRWQAEADKWADQARIAVQALPAPVTQRPWWKRLAG